MAFSGLHVVCAYAGSYRRDKSQAILGKRIWSESPATGATSVSAAPADTDNGGQPIMRLRASAESWVSIGPAPNASTGVRFLVPANTDYDVFVEFGDKVQWISA